MTTSISNSGRPSAVVVGLCSHGLATVRALASNDIEVHALECDRSLPGVRTRLAEVHLVSAIVGSELIENLIRLASDIRSPEKPVLFVINDHMVLEVAKHWSRLEPLYCLSWARSVDAVVQLLYKSALEAHCQTRGLRYPRSWIIKDALDLAAIREQLEFPIIIKPVKPLGGFKARRLETIEAAEALTRQHSSDLPFLLQQYIAGDDTKLSFCALFLDRGRVINRFDGRKLMSYPPALGQTLIAEPVVDDELYEYTVRFFSGLDLSGPVSLEVKRDSDGLMWIIEPTLGRTDFWIAVCVANGVNLPYTEYCHTVGINPPAMTQRGLIRWFDTEKDPTSFLRYAWGKGMIRQWCLSVFPYWKGEDMRPFLVSLGRTFGRALTACFASRIQPSESSRMSTRCSP